MAGPLVRIEAAGTRYEVPAVQVDRDDYPIYVATWRPHGPEQEMLSAGASLALAVADVDPPQLLVRLTAPTCERCGEEMEFHAQLRTYVCAEEEDD